MSHTQAIIDVALILCAVVTWVTMWRRDSAQQVELDDHDADLGHAALRADALANRLDVLERDRFDDAARRLDDDARRLEDRRP